MEVYYGGGGSFCGNSPGLRGAIEFYMEFEDRGEMVVSSQTEGEAVDVVNRKSSYKDCNLPAILNTLAIDYCGAFH
jgi:hypothetical protein